MARFLRRIRKAKWWQPLCCCCSCCNNEDVPRAPPPSPEESEIASYEERGIENLQVSPTESDSAAYDQIRDVAKQLLEQLHIPSPQLPSSAEPRRNISEATEESSSPWDSTEEDQDTLDDVSSIEDEEWIPSEIPDWEEPVEMMTLVREYVSPVVSSEQEVDHLEKEEREPLPDTTRNGCGGVGGWGATSSPLATSSLTHGCGHLPSGGRLLLEDTRISKCLLKQASKALACGCSGGDGFSPPLPLGKEKWIVNQICWEAQGPQTALQGDSFGHLGALNICRAARTLKSGELHYVSGKNPSPLPPVPGLETSKREGSPPAGLARALSYSESDLWQNGFWRKFESLAWWKQRSGHLQLSGNLPGDPGPLGRLHRPAVGSVGDMRSRSATCVAGNDTGDLEGSKRPSQPPEGSARPNLVPSLDSSLFWEEGAHGKDPSPSAILL
ncbi:hypothetical protein JRQ81_011845 [Phrynocephalus forsythii]|uniref:Uncharacterized protein n=1 Tax=Phrynocephalus forsythii TaxID=171643 RepID=A0A9Q0X9U1_9SAUR|nr:hypothetical protein JRQ81_011845 [Phrynocephalus forsythii]